MRTAYLVHITAGSLVVLFGYVALYLTKGARLHRKSGVLFVHEMLATAVAGMIIEVLGPQLSSP